VLPPHRSVGSQFRQFEIFDWLDAIHLLLNQVGQAYPKCFRMPRDSRLPS
jgi:hypothetical protein